MRRLQRLDWLKVRRWLHRLGLLFGGLLLLQQVIQALQSVRDSQVNLRQPLFLVGAIGMSVLATGVLVMGWLLIMRQSGVQLAWLQATQGYTLSFLPRYIPGSVWGYLSRNEWLLRQHGVTFGVSNAASILEVFFIVLTGAIVAVSYQLPRLAGSHVILLPIACIVVLGGLVALAISRLASLLSTCSSAWGTPWTRLKSLRLSLREVIWIEIVYVGLWLCHGSMLRLVSLAMGYSPSVSLLESAAVFYVAWVAGFLVVFVPAGLGIRESLLAFLLVSVVGLASGQAVVISVIARLSSLIGEMIWVSISLIALRITMISRPHQNST